MNKSILSIAAALLLSLATMSAHASDDESTTATSPNTESAQQAPITPAVSPAPAPLSGISAINQARMAAVADSVSTHIAIASGGVEQNGLVNTSPAGLVALAAVKLGVLQIVDNLPEQERAMGLKTSAALWTGVSVNNILVAVSAGGAVPVVAALAAGYWMWGHTAERLEAERAAKLALSNEQVIDTAAK